MRGPLFTDTYRPQLSGHETFPLRYGWLKKAHDAIANAAGNPENKFVFLREDAIARFGVGKNMVASMRHWGSAAGILSEPKGSPTIEITELGDFLFGPEGRDPYVEHPATLWLMHWHIASHPEKTTWFWAFNNFPALTFEREHLVNGISRLAQERKWARVSPTTVKNDVACFIRTYVALQPTKRSGNDSVLESPLIELGLIKATGKRDGFRFVRGPKLTLGEGVFVYALLDFWKGYAANSATLSSEAIAHEPGGPGRVFLLDENDVGDRLATLDEVTSGRLRWSETAGLKQVARDPDLDFDSRLSFVRRDYASGRGLEAT